MSPIGHRIRICHVTCDVISYKEEKKRTDPDPESAFYWQELISRYLGIKYYLEIQKLSWDKKIISR